MGSDLSYDIKYSVKIPATKIRFNKTKLILKRGKSLKLKIKVIPSKTTDNLKWKSSNINIATVSKTGIVKAKKRGVAYITVTSTSGTQKKIKIIVK